MENIKKVRDQFNGKLGSYTVVETEDQSFTLHSEFFDENCHSKCGAVAETLYNYFEGCKVQREKFDRKTPFTIFEVGFGLGIGPKVTFEKLTSSEQSYEFISTELDEDLVLWTGENDKCEIFNNLEKKSLSGLTYYQSVTGNFTLKILIGDARETTKLANELGLLKEVNAIYQDAFSPKKNAALWTTEWFTLLKEVSSNDVIMSTYSSAGVIRKSMLNAGWKVFKRIGFGTKRSSTVAQLHGEMDQVFIENVLRTADPALEDRHLKE